MFTSTWHTHYTTCVMYTSPVCSFAKLFRHVTVGAWHDMLLGCGPNYGPAHVTTRHGTWRRITARDLRFGQSGRPWRSVVAPCQVSNQTTWQPNDNCFLILARLYLELVIARVYCSCWNWLLVIARVYCSCLLLGRVFSKRFSLV